MTAVRREMLYLDAPDQRMDRLCVIESPQYQRAVMVGRPTFGLTRYIDARVCWPEAKVWGYPRSLADDTAQDLTVSNDFHHYDDLPVELRQYQHDALNRMAAATDGVLVSPAGSGKTVMLADLIRTTGQNACVLCHSVALAKQTQAALERLLGVPVGFVGGPKRDKGERVVVAMVQTLSRNPDALDVDRFGFVALDEAHHAPAASFLTVIQRFPARYRYGLTATPTRKDGLHPLLYLCIGPILATVPRRDVLTQGGVVPLEPRWVETGRAFEPRYIYRGGREPEMDYCGLMTQIATDAQRNGTIATVAMEYDSQTLILTERIEHAEVLAYSLNARLAHGEMKRKDIGAALAGWTAEGGRLVATTSLLGEGIDVPGADVLILAMPNASPAKTTQAVGRVIRPAPGKTRAIVVDFLDDCAVLRNSARTRARVYDAHRGVR